MVSHYRGSMMEDRMKKKPVILLLLNCISLILCACGGTSTGLTNAVNETSVVESPVSDADKSAGQSKELVNHADKKYPYCNSRNLYVQDQFNMDTMKQYTLDGKLAQTFLIPDDLEMLYVNDEEMIVQRWKEDEPSVLYSIPIIQTEGGDVLEVDNIEEITKSGDEKNGEEFVDAGDLYADKNYLVYISAYHSFYVYDRINKEFIKCKNDPKVNHGFSNGCTSILDDSDDEYVVFNTEPIRRKGEDVSYGFCVYHMGDDRITMIDEKCETAAPYLFWDEEQKVIYAYEDEYNDEIEADDVWMYDCQTKKKEILISAEEIRDFLDKYPYSDGNAAKGYISEMYLDGNILYLGVYESDDPLVLRYDLSKKGTLRMESGLNDCLKQMEGEGDVYGINVYEGKCLIEFMEGRYACFDMETEQYKMITNEEIEKFYFQCIGWWDE